MCGLVGIFGNLNYKHPDIFKDALYINALRGPHSTGVAFISIDKPPVVLKEMGPPTVLFSNEEFRPNLNKYMSLIGFMGHNRWATQGAVKVENAHPFTHGHITLCHNGTLTRLERMRGLTMPYMFFDTDSETICHALSRTSIEEVWYNLYGAAVLVYWDDNEKSLNFISNGERPFHFITATNKHTKNVETIYWASESWMMEACMDRHLTENQEKLVEHDMFKPKVNTLLSVTMASSTTINITARDIPPPKKEAEVYHYGIRGGRWPGQETFLPMLPPPANSGVASKIPDNHPVMSRKDRRRLEKQQKALERQRSKTERDGLIAMFKPWIDKGYSLARFTMSEFRFREMYDLCNYCYMNMEDEYEQAIILNGTECICGACALAYSAETTDHNNPERIQ